MKGIDINLGQISQAQDDAIPTSIIQSHPHQHYAKSRRAVDNRTRHDDALSPT